MRDWSLIYTLSGHKEKVNDVEPTSTNGLASCSKDKTIIIWDLVSQNVSRSLTHSNDEEIIILKQMSNGYLASADTDKLVVSWNLNTFAQVASYAVNKKMRAMDQAGSILLVVTDESKILVLIANTLALKDTSDPYSGVNHPPKMNAIKFSSNGLCFALGLDNNYFQYWKAYRAPLGFEFPSSKLREQTQGAKIKSIDRCQNVFFSGDDSKSVYYWEISVNMNFLGLVTNVNTWSGAELFTDSSVGNIDNLACLNNTRNNIALD
jgi:WD40 repeat protein